jgi:hypothetical protein
LGFHRKHLFLTFLNEDKAYLLSIGKNGDLPKIPEQGLRGSAELTGVAGVTAEPYSVESAISPDLYSYSRTPFEEIFTEFLCLEYSHPEAARASFWILCCPEM